MRRSVAWLCLLIALAIPFVSQARVAYGLAKSRSEIGRNVLESSQEEEDEEYDGSDLAAVTAAQAQGPLDSSLLAPPAFDLLAPRPLAFLPASDPVLRPEGRVYWPPPTVRERLASLQSFLI